MRQRTAKTLGTRHDLNYFKYFTPFRLWRMALGLAVPVLALLWLGISSRQSFYSKGQLSSAHAFFSDQCSVCHTGQARATSTAGFRKPVTDSACLSCHQAPAHQPNQLFTPSCSSCHVEHQGLVQLDHVRDAQCVQCHSGLQTIQGPPHYVADIRGFNRNHPEFAPLRNGSAGYSAITFSHHEHRGDSIRGPLGPVKLQCDDCHRPQAEIGGPWTYADPHLQGTATPADPTANLFLDTTRELMAPVTYEQHCLSCHALQFDQRFTAPVPHKTPEIVHAFVVQQFQDYIAGHPEAIHESRPADRNIPGVAIMQPTAPRNAEEWVQQNVDRTEQLLWGVTCKLCHQLEFPSSGGGNASGLPRIKPSSMPARWLPHATFSHEAHSGVACESCHALAPASETTSQILIPSIKTCQSCHNGDPSAAGKAENSCFLCHQYHQWKDRTHFRGTHTIQELTGAGSGR
ncbi:MAG TPA: cytochrome c3 family protein [Candidatus Angelobacter sp.]